MRKRSFSRADVVARDTRAKPKVEITIASAIPTRGPVHKKKRREMDGIVGGEANTALTRREPDVTTPGIRRKFLQRDRNAPFTM